MKKMSLRKILLTNRSKATCIEIAHYLSANPAAFKDFFYSLYSSDEQLSAHAAWVITALTDLYPHLLQERQALLLAVLKTVQHNEALRRNTMRFWGKKPIDEKIEGEVYDLGLHYMSADFSIAVKVHAMYACKKIAFKYPDLLYDFKLHVEDMQRKYQMNSAGIASACSRVLKEIAKRLK